MTGITKGPWAVDPLDLGIVGDVSTSDGYQCVAQAQQLVGDDQRQTQRRTNAQAIALLPELIEVLEFYANSESYDCGMGDVSITDYEVMADNGKLARSILARINGAPND